MFNSHFNEIYHSDDEGVASVDLIYQYPDSFIEQEQIYPMEFLEQIETNQDRLNMIKNLINQKEIYTKLNKEDILCRNESESDTNESESDDILSDMHNLEILLEKYSSLMRISRCDDSDGSDNSDRSSKTNEVNKDNRYNEYIEYNYHEHDESIERQIYDEEAESETDD